MIPLYPTVRRLLFTIVFGLSFYPLFSQPVISSFSPAAGPAGLQVVIKGTNFSPTAASNIVRFGAVQATVLSAAADSLLVRVPVGANYQELTVTVTSTGLTGYYNTKAPFRETFGPGGTAFSAGSFAAGATFSVYGDAISVMDLNGDGTPEIISGTIGINGVQEGRRAFGILNNSSSSGTIAFTAQHGSATNAPYYCAAADMNGDGRPDVVAWDTTTTDEIAVYLNTGSGGTISFDGGTRYAYGGAISGQPGKIIVRDLDGDGKPDVLTIHTVPTGDTSYFTFLQNTGSGGTVTLVQLPDLIAQLYNTGQRTISDFIVEDFDGDGKPDIMSVQQNGFYFYHNTSVPGTISFSAGAQTNYISPGTTYSGLTAADMDGDGFPELIYVNPTTNQLMVNWNDGQSGTPAFWVGATLSTGNSPQRLAVGDLDGDGKPDIAVSNMNGGSVSVYRNTYAGGQNALSFDAQAVYSTGAAGTAYELAIVDLDGDRRPDIVAASGIFNSPVTILRNLMPYAAAPTVTAFTPTTGTAGTKVGITGTNFTGALGVSFGGVAATGFTVNSPDSITAVVANGASGNMVLITPGGSDTVAGFVYGAEPAPTVTSFTPDSAGILSTITIKGSHFTNLVSATVGGMPLRSLSLVSDSVITGQIINGASGYVAVFTTVGADSLSGFTYIPQTPILYYFTPTSGRPGDTIHVKGYYYTGATGVSIGGVPAASFQVLNDSMVVAVVGYGASGAVSVTVGFVTGSLNGFTFIEPAPAVGAFSPTSALQGATVTISGHYFTGATAVSFGGTPAASFTVSNDSTVLAVVGTGSSGMVSVTTTQGNSSLAGFTFGVPPPTVPTITAFSPTSGKRGDSVTISGHYFTGTTAVTFGGTNAASYVVLSDSVLLTVVGTGSTGLVTVTTPQGYGPSMGTFIFLPDTTAPTPPVTPPDTTAPLPPDTTAPVPPVTPPDTTAPAPPDTTATPAAFGVKGFAFTVSGGQVILEWQTSHDQGVARYIIQEGSSSTQLFSIDSVVSEQQDSAIYTYLDPSIRTGVVWYRLLAVDASGKQVYSGTLSVVLLALTSNAFPNPAVGVMQVTVPGSLANSQFELVDMSGRVLLVVPVSPGTAQVRINVAGINTGTYQLNWSDGTHQKTQTVVIMH
jgi:FG-GAP-like repeat/IPT/TIG domain/Secretion system C-terminal sorting domain